jgi:hypothetical protein
VISKVRRTQRKSWRFQNVISKWTKEPKKKLGFKMWLQKERRVRYARSYAATKEKAGVSICDFKNNEEPKKKLEFQ